MVGALCRDPVELGLRRVVVTEQLRRDVAELDVQRRRRLIRALDGAMRVVDDKKVEVIQSADPARIGQ